ncbi:hypothetical protein F4780DRAFT_797476 [Xylariomycetidae sp. FL0641]|nr:hypothetical protein F4780DRAFT_797476 [Xylariomycetidae sp. FL0641]
MAAAATTSSPQADSPFFALPPELRLEIYEHLLRLAPDPILISPARRHLRLVRAPDPTTKTGGGGGGGRGGRIAGRGGAPLLGPYRGEPKRLPRGAGPHVAVLRSCKRINEEATPVLYGGNEFVVAYSHQTPYHAPSFFPWYLRRSTLRAVRSLTFETGCPCAVWAAHANPAWATTGRHLARLLFPSPNRATTTTAAAGRPRALERRPFGRDARAAYARVADRIAAADPRVRARVGEDWTVSWGWRKGER